MDERVFIYLRLRAGEHLLARSKIREFGGLGGLLADFLRGALKDRREVPAEVEPDAGDAPVLDYVDANTERVLISFRVDTVRREQVIEGCIPPAYQPRMLDPEATAFSVRRFAERAGAELGLEGQEELHERLSRSQVDLLARIRSTIDAEGRFVVRVPLR